MADKRISQLVERTDIANNDVVPIVAFGATTTNKATISSIQEFMQENLDLGVTSVGITLGSSGTDVNVTGSPITTSGNITINIPDASATARGVVTTGTQTFAGAKTFSGGINSTSAVLTGALNGVNASFTSTISSQDRIQTDTIFSVKHNSTVFTLNGYNSIQGNINSFAVYNGTKGMRINFPSNESFTHTLPDASGTLALTSDLTGYVTLGTAQTITAQKTFTTSGSSDTMIISHGSGSGIALDVIKAGNGEAIRIQKTSGTGNAVTITGGALSAVAGQFSGDLQSATRVIAAVGGESIVLTPNLSSTSNRIESAGTLPLALVSAAAITMAAGGTTPQITLATTGAVTLTGALNGTSATFTGGVVVGLGLSAGIFNQNTPVSFSTDGTSNSPSLTLFKNSSSSSEDVFRVQSFIGSVVTVASIKATGAATFSSSVTANAGTFSTDTAISSGDAFVINSSAASSGAGAFGAGLIFTGVGSSGRRAAIVPVQGTADNDTLGLAFFTHPSATGSNPLAEAMRITSAGNVGIGTASPANLLAIEKSSNSGSGSTFPRLAIKNTLATQGDGSSTFNFADILVSSGNESVNMFLSTTFAAGSWAPAGIINVSTNHDLQFKTNNTERMRITSGGDVLINATSNSATSDDGSKFVSNGRLFQVSAYDDNTQESLSMYSTTASAYRFYVGWGGTIFATSPIISTISDVRVKENIRDLDSGLDKIMLLKPRIFDWKEGKGKDIKNDRGFIAQEFEEVFPDLIDIYKQELEEGEEPYKSVRADLIPTLVKAIQELKAEIDSLKTK